MVLNHVNKLIKLFSNIVKNCSICINKLLFFVFLLMVSRVLQIGDFNNDYKNSAGISAPSEIKVSNTIMT